MTDLHSHAYNCVTGIGGFEVFEIPKKMDEHASKLIGEGWSSRALCNPQVSYLDGSPPNTKLMHVYECTNGIE